MALIKVVDKHSGEVLFEKDMEKDSVESDIQQERKPSKASKKAPIDPPAAIPSGLF